MDLIPDVTITFTEVRIPVPWGHISGRWYGDQNERPILALHGWQDNCGTFAKLAPLISPYRSLLCIDLPGHGLSSYLPTGVIYHNLEFVRVILRLMQIYKWEKVSLLGHSMSGSLAFHFASFFPDRVDMIISLDIIKALYRSAKIAPALYAAAIEKALKYNDCLWNNASTTNSEPPSYTFQQCETMLCEGTRKSVELENCKYILERNITKSHLYPDKYFFSRDVRIKYLIEMNPNLEMTLNMAERICSANIPYLIIKGGKSKYPDSAASELDEYMAKNNKNFESYIYPDGTHHLHLNNPKPVAQLVIRFLQKHDREQSKVIKSKI
ncbi:probable serine hydrolase [Musca autumnalis]|uniref:probable serine hydrolase n=1 Tax=Musca autumnalis TaxID=221902 RepID=UPI003CF7FD5D